MGRGGEGREGLEREGDKSLPGLPSGPQTPEMFIFEKPDGARQRKGRALRFLSPHLPLHLPLHLPQGWTGEGGARRTHEAFY